RSYARIIPTTSVPIPAFAPPPLDLPRAKEKIRLGHLPTHLVLPFDTIFAPHLRTIFGKTAPWETPADEDIKHAWAIIFPEERALEFHTPLGVIIQKLVLDRLSSWRHNLGNAGILALQKRVFPSLPTDGVGTTALEVRSEWCTWAISRTEENHPFYFAEVIEDVDGNVESQSVRFYRFFFFWKIRVELTQISPFLKGIFQSRMISAVLGSYINGIAPLQINTKTDRPIGALVLAIQSVRGSYFFAFVALQSSSCRQSEQSLSTRQVLCASHHVLQPISQRPTGVTIPSTTPMDTQHPYTQRPPLLTLSNN
ncbi:hypothetical protein BJY52DRAFT_1127987, partial [Lactarius psammicola]